MADACLHGSNIIREDIVPRPVDPAKMTTIGVIGTGESWSRR